MSRRWPLSPAGGDLVMAVIVAGFAVYVYGGGSRYLQTVVINSITIMVVAYSWNLISGYTRYFSFGQVAFYGIGAYGAAVLMTKAGLSWPLALVAATAASALAAAPLGWVLLRLRGIYFALGTVALFIALSIVVTNTGWVGSGQGLSLPLITDFNVILLLSLVIGAVAIGTTFVLSRSRLGLRAQALGADEDAIKTLGVRTLRVKLTMFVISAALAGAAGAVAALNAGFVTPTTGFSETVNTQSIVYTLIGGVGTVWGPLLGTGVAQAMVTQFASTAAREVEIALGLLIIVIVTLTPGGIIGLLNRIGFLRRGVILHRRRPGTAAAVAPGWLRRFPSYDNSGDGGALLDCRGVTVRFRGVTAVDDVDLRVAEHEFVAVIGANGAGKTTLFNGISGYVPRAHGTVRLAGRDVSRLDATRLARAGLSRTFQVPRLADSLTVWENVLLGSLLDSKRREAQDRASLIIDQLGLRDVCYEPVERLGPGTRRRVELARVVATRPRVILLDEALAGMSSEEIAEVRHAVAALREWGVEAIVGVEHVLSAVRDLADRMIALDFGRVVAEGAPDHVLEHEEVVNSYLGAPAAAEEEAAPDRRVEPRARTAQAEAAIEARDLIAGYGQVRVLWDISMRLAPGEFIGVLGASGAGKTTLCRALTGACTVHAGSVTFEDADITGRPSHLVAQMGVAHVPSNRELFPDLSVRDNLRLGAVAWSGATTKRQLDRVLDLFPEVKPLMDRKAASLSGGQQQMVAIGRALMHEPKLLVLDEPSTGLAPIVVRRLMQALRSLTEEGVAVMIVEQNAVETLRVVERAYVLQEGRLAFSGTAEQLRGDPRLARAYLGSDTNAAPSGASTPPVMGLSGDVTGAAPEQRRIP